MALVPGMRCPLCARPLEANEAVIMFPPFAANDRDPLAPFSDGSFHEACIDRHPLGRRARLALAEILGKATPANRVCAVCGRRILDPDDHFALGYLTDDPSHALYEFNLVQLHRSHLADWAPAAHLLEVLEEMRINGRASGPGIDWLIAELTKR